MDPMRRRIILAVFLGALVGVAVGYAPQIQQASAPGAQLLMQQAGRTNVVSPTFRPASAYGAAPLLMAVLVGLLIAVPVFLVARRRAR